MKTGHYLARWRDEYWLAYVPVPFNGLGALDAGNRPSSAALGFTNHPRGPYLRPEDRSKPPVEQRHDYYVDWYSRRLTRQIVAESTLYKLRWRGFPVQDPSWVDPAPHGDRVTVRMYPETWPMFTERGRAVEGMSDISKVPLEFLNTPEEYYFRVVAPMLREDGWLVYEQREMGLGGQTEKYIRELELIEVPWPKDMAEGLKD